jgi:hypothetical protein
MIKPDKNHVRDKRTQRETLRSRSGIEAMMMAVKKGRRRRRRLKEKRDENDDSGKTETTERERDQTPRMTSRD